MELHFRSGADVVLQGPARLEFVSADSVRLRKGKLAAQVPPEARGFQILTPHGTVIDLGTAFGLAVEDNGDAKVVVFQGKVDAYSNRNAKRPLNLVQDQAARIDSTGVARNAEKPDVEAAGFVRAIVPPPVIVPRTLALDFRHPVAGSLQDRDGNGIGLTHRMAGTGFLLGENDDHLWLNTKAGQLEVTTTESDLNAPVSTRPGRIFWRPLGGFGLYRAGRFSDHRHLLEYSRPAVVQPVRRLCRDWQLGRASGVA